MELGVVHVLRLGAAHADAAQRRASRAGASAGLAQECALQLQRAMHHVFRALVLPAALLAFGACASSAPARSPGPEPAGASTTDGPVTARPASARLAAPAATAAPAPAGPPTAPACRLTATETQGCGSSDVEALVAPARSRLEACRQGSGGKLRVRVREDGGKLAFDAQPGSSLDPRERQCALEALASLNETSTNTNLSYGPAVPPTGFTSLLTIEW